MPRRSNLVGRVDLCGCSVNQREREFGSCLLKSSAMNVRAPAMIVESSVCTRKGKKSPIMSFHLYLDMFFSSKLQILHEDNRIVLSVAPPL